MNSKDKQVLPPLGESPIGQMMKRQEDMADLASQEAMKRAAQRGLGNSSMTGTIPLVVPTGSVTVRVPDYAQEKEPYTVASVLGLEMKDLEELKKAMDEYGLDVDNVIALLHLMYNQNE